MAYDEVLANRVRTILGARGDVTERKMFGGLAFMIGDHMACGVLGRELIVRIGPEAHDAAIAQPYVRAFDFTGRPSRGMVYVGPDGSEEPRDLARWVEMGIAHSATRGTEQRR